ncbi:DUF5685 family protein [Streptomyces sp. JW3]|uniref:DUF5685 family protein n=1 Tax=Streptomyces sp. JW3 TaxID=3456955 RepID=UPI003FA45766
MAHLCGLCLALRGDHGQFARIVTNYDGLLISVLTEAQAPAGRRGGLSPAGPCPLRGMRTASVAHGEGARLAAAVSLVLASAKVRDHVADGDGLLARRPVAPAARRVAARWDAAGARSGGAVGFDTAVLVDAVDRQGGIEALAGPGTPVRVVTEPTETATAAAFAHTAHLAGRPHSAAPLAEAGRLFGRLAHLLDAVADREADAASGAWNPPPRSASLARGDPHPPPGPRSPRPGGWPTTPCTGCGSRCGRRSSATVATRSSCHRRHRAYGARTPPTGTAVTASGSCTRLPVGAGPGRPDGRTAVDRNRARSPPCVFADRFGGPFPLPGNTLDIAVEAGERRLARVR